MTDEQIGQAILDRLWALTRDRKTADQVFAELAAVHAALDPDAEIDETPENASKAFDLCMHGAECYFRLAAIYAAAEDELIRREQTDRE